MHPCYFTFAGPKLEPDREEGHHIGDQPGLCAREDGLVAVG